MTEREKALLEALHMSLRHMRESMHRTIVGKCPHTEQTLTVGDYFGRWTDTLIHIMALLREDPTND